MAKTPLQRLVRLGQSVWIDYLSRDLLHSGELERMMREDAVVGVTSNPTIFQKALSDGQRLRRAAARGARGDTRPEGDLHPARRARTSATPAISCAGVWEKTGGRDGYVSIEVDPTLAYDTEATTAEAMRLHALIDRPNLFVKIPATKPGLPAIEDMIAKGKSINVTLIFSLERYAEVAEAYIRGLERLVARGGDPREGRVGRELLRLPRRHRDGSAAGRARRPRRPQGQARDREREARLPALPGDLRRRALGVPRLEGRDAAALPLGLDLDEEPGLPRRHVRRGADRPDDREHDARGDDRGLPGSRARSRPRSSRGLDEARRVFERLPAAGVDYDDVTETLEREGVEKFADSFAELLDGIRAASPSWAA